MDKIYTVDRFENEYIVLETPDGKIINIHKNNVLDNVDEGDCLVYKNDYFLLDEKATKERRQEIIEKMKRMWKD
ncbi:MAG: DUF3006 domain-containing protein [Clostridium sp.]|uniref:DUF3006 domain-containing protein n=1 Tax=Clostridium sp. DSM 8431 TaxID=1761781 RepID=UPI0008E1F9AD|nr:DUF3006 domain-containing protein [Clostridium sp. DSM 8431]MCR4943074.1 DUF3006 domain-containing protein [Clostridium sp.]SFU86655.1 Protein of unknown function [Clostridium sp. DSM 8431]